MSRRSISHDWPIYLVDRVQAAGLLFGTSQNLKKGQTGVGSGKLVTLLFDKRI